MDRRKLFGGVMAVSLMAAALFGAVYAWEAIRSRADTSTVGVNNFNIVYSPTGLQLGPNGHDVIVANGSIQNSGTFDLEIDGGTVTINSVTQLPGAGTCAAGDFAGSVIVTNSGPVAPGATGGGFNVEIETLSGAPADCQEDQVGYTVIIMVSNP